MMKKYSWIAALVLALSLAFFACDNGGGGKKGGGGVEEPEIREWKTVFDMQDASNGMISHAIQEQDVGPVTFPAGSGTTPISPLVKAGNMPEHISSFEIVEVDGKKALKYVTVATWGPGFDLPNSVFGFFGGNAEYAEGDTIVITGTAEGAAVDLALNRNQGATQQILGNRVEAAGDFEIEATLTAADVTVIKGNEQGVIRFEDRVGATTVTITNIVIEGYRPVQVRKLDTPAISLSGSTISWTAVNGAGGYKVLALEEGGSTPVEITLGAAAESYNLATSTLAPTVYTESAVTYSITLKALGVSGVTTDSDVSNAVNYTKEPPAPPPQIGIKVNAVDQDVFVLGHGAGTVIEALEEEDGYKITYGSGAYGATYAYFEVDFGAGKTLADYSKLTLKWKGDAGDIGYKGMFVFASATEFTDSVSNASGSYAATQNFAAANTAEATGTFYLSAPAVTGQKAYIAIALWAAATGGTPPVATSYEVYDIAFEELVPSAVDIKTIGGVSAPIAGAGPSAAVTETAQFTGTVTWADDSGTPLTGNFGTSTVYVATINLAAKAGYTFTGVAADFFEVDGADATNLVDSGVVTATFPATGATALSSFDITVTGATGATTSVDYADFITINAAVSPVVNGYQVDETQGNNYALAGFAIDLGDKTLADFKAITLTFEAVSGDYGYKRVQMLAAAKTDGLPRAQAFTVADYQVTRDSRAANNEVDPPIVADPAGAYSNNTEASGNTDPKNMTIYLDPTRVASGAVWTANELEIAFWYNGGISAFKITNIVFVP
jgi:hypothetical protein